MSVTESAITRPKKDTFSRRRAGCSQPEGSAYVNTTPMVRPAAPLATARIPARDNVTPAGKAGPLVETPNVPPLTIPLEA